MRCFDLNGQLTGGNQNQRTRLDRVASFQLVDDGNGKDGGLAAAGLGAGNEVLAAERGGKRQALNFSRGDVAGVREVRLNDVAQLHFSKSFQ